MVACITVIIMDSEAEVIKSIQLQTDVTDLVRLQPAFHFNNPLLVFLMGVKFRPLATLHDTFIQNIAILHFTRATLVKNKIHKMASIQFGLDCVL